MLRPLLLALLLVPLAGCFSDAPAAESEDAAAPAADAATAPDGTTLPAGNATTGRIVPVAFEGSVPTHAYACAYAAVTGVCTPNPGEWNNRLDVTERGNLTAGTLTATWTPTGPASEEMYLAFYGWNDEDFHEVGFVSGPSPLSLTLEPTTLDASMEYVVYVGTMGQGAYAVAAGAYANAAQEQAFTLDGTLTFA